MTIQSAFLRPMTVNDLDKVLSWRNDPAVRRFMTTRHVITPDEHKHWFDASLLNPDRCLLIFNFHGVDSGFLNFTSDVVAKCAEWGFYLSPERLPSAGRALGLVGLHYGFEELAVDEIYGQVQAENIRSINFHERLGFTRISSAPYVDDKSVIDDLHFRLLRRKWREGIEL